MKPSLWTTAAITYTDRLLAFVVPLFVLKMLHNPVAYTAVEYIISMSVIIATFIDLGIRNYILFHYRALQDKSRATMLALGAYFCVALLQLAVIALACAYARLAGTGAADTVASLTTAALLRASAVGATAVAYQLAILYGRPALASLPSLVQWLLVLAAFMAWPATQGQGIAYGLVVPSLPMMLAALVMSGRALASVGLQASLGQMAHAFRWGWPLLAAAALSMGIANVARIYGFSHLAQHELVGFNFWLRVLSIVQLTHATAMTALALEIYEHREPGLIMANVRRYALALSVAIVLVLALYATTQSLHVFAPAIAPLAFVGIASYTLLWCFGAYAETYLTRDGRPGAVLRFSAISAAVYVALLIALRPASSEALAAIMLAPAALYLFLLIKSISGSAAPVVAIQKT